MRRLVRFFSRHYCAVLHSLLSKWRKAERDLVFFLRFELKRRFALTDQAVIPFVSFCAYGAKMRAWSIKKSRQSAYGGVARSELEVNVIIAIESNSKDVLTLLAKNDLLAFIHMYTVCTCTGGPTTLEGPAIRQT